MLTKSDIVTLLTNDQTTSKTQVEELADLILGAGGFVNLGPSSGAGFTFASFQPEAGNTKTINIGSLVLPKRGIIRCLYVEYITAFAGAGITSAALSISDESTNTYINTDVFRATGATIGAHFSGSTFNAFNINKTAASNLQATLTVGALESINNLNAGAFKIYAVIGTIPTN